MRSEMETAMQNETSAVLASKNQDRGFFEATQHFLDSRYGRHLADEVVNALIGRLEFPAAIDSAVAHWMRQRIESRIQDELGIPEGLPYLTGFVCMHEALLEANG